ncbi:MITOFERRINLIKE 1, chloroplastic-like protein [Drosera capensis]
MESSCLSIFDCSPLLLDHLAAHLLASTKPQQNPPPVFLSISLNQPQPQPQPQPQHNTKPKPHLTILDRSLIGAAAGAIAGAFTYFCLHPLDTIKTKLQTRGAAQLYTNSFDVALKILESNGILGFYSGISAVVVGSALSSAVYFGTCEFAKSVMGVVGDGVVVPRVLVPPLAGALGNVVSSGIMVPKELITQQMQAGAKGRSWEVLLQVLEREGVMGLYKGYWATLLRNLPAGVLSYSSFEYLKAWVLARRNAKQLEPVESVCCGALAGAISASMTTPLDVVKTRLMTQGVEKTAAVMYGGVVEMVKLILKEEGSVGFTRGMGPRVVHSACFSALGYFAFETARLTIMKEYVKRMECKKMDDAPS